MKVSFKSQLQEATLKITAHYKVTVWSVFFLWQFLLKSIRAASEPENAPRFLVLEESTRTRLIV